MLLYHFTSPECLSAIRAGGLLPGNVHVSAGRLLNAVWLTTRPEGAHGLEAGGAFLTDDERDEAFHWSGEMPPHGARLAKPASIRITVDVHANDRDLHEWLPWARQHVDPEMMALLHPVGSSLHHAKSWRLYFGTIAPSNLVAVEQVESSPATRGRPLDRAQPRTRPSSPA